MTKKELIAALAEYPDDMDVDLDLGGRWADLKEVAAGPESLQEDRNILLKAGTFYA